MELSGRPLFDNPLDHTLFVPSEESALVEENCRAGVNTLVLGAAGTGKTTLLRQVLFQLRESEFPALGVDAGLADSPLELLGLIAAELGRSQAGEGGVGPHGVAGLGEVGLILDRLAWLQGGRADGRRTAVLIDLPRDFGAHELFGRFRDELWQLPYTWIVAAPSEMRVDLLTPPADAFFEEVIELGPMSTEQQAELLERRLAAGEENPVSVPVESGGNPRALLSLVRRAVRSGEDFERHLQALAERERAVAQLGRPASMLYAELGSYGPASASDREFLDRLGWSRQRAAQVFAELERAGFVIAETRSGANGRPRKVFTIAPRVLS